MSKRIIIIVALIAVGIAAALAFRDRVFRVALGVRW